VYHVALPLAPFDLHPGRNEALHQIAFRRADIGLVQLDAMFTQRALKRGQLLVAAGVQADHGLLGKFERQFTQLYALLLREQRFDGGALPGLGKGHRGLRRQTDFLRAGVSGQPEFDLRPLCRIAPVAGQYETLCRSLRHAGIILYAHTASMGVVQRLQGFQAAIA
jgi:hypothetical protein